MHGAPELCTIYDAAPKNTITPRPSPIFRIKAPYEYRGVRGGRGGESGYRRRCSRESLSGGYCFLVIETAGRVVRYIDIRNNC